MNGLNVAQVAKRYCIGQDKVRAWIRSGLLRAINTSMTECARPRFVVMPDAIAEFEKRRAVSTPAPRPKRERRPVVHDYFPD